MDEQELNRKLAEWVGFQYKSVPDYKWGGEKLAPFDPEGDEIAWYPNFTQSLDACFEQLVPVAIDKIMAEQGCSSDVAYAVLFKKWLQELELIIPKAALALCLAIEKLIDKEATDG